MRMMHATYLEMVIGLEHRPRVAHAPHLAEPLTAPLPPISSRAGLLWFVAFFGTLFLGVQIGLMLAVGVSLALVIVESIRPQMSVLWRLPGTPIYRNIKQESAGQFVPGVVVLRIGASMYFANVC